MSIEHKILGNPFMDNSMYVNIDTGQKSYHLLFDLGYGCLNNMDISTIMKIDHVFISHLHMDHIAGFDYFFRFNYMRSVKPLHFWVPEDCATILHKRFNGFIWNLIDTDSPGIFFIHEVKSNTILNYQVKTAEKYEKLTLLNEMDNAGVILENEDFEVDNIILNHGIPSVGYYLKEKTKYNISNEKLNQNGLLPGPWLGQLKNNKSKPTDIIKIDDEKGYTVDELNSMLITETDGENIAYLTDFYVDENEIKRIGEFLQGCQTLVCETQYNNKDEALADKNFHMTAGRAGRLASEAKVNEMIIFHLSNRYTYETVVSLLDDARKSFVETKFPADWFAPN